MKKCPYCYTLMNDDVNTCPHCLKDTSNVREMKEISSKEYKMSFYTFMFGIIIALGSVAAALSIHFNRLSFVEKYDALKIQYILESSSLVKETMGKELENLFITIKNLQFREVSFYVLAGIGVIMLFYSLISFIIRKVKKSKRIAK